MDGAGDSPACPEGVGGFMLETEHRLLGILLAGVHIYNRIIGNRKEPSHYKAPRCLHNFYGSGRRHPSIENLVRKVTTVLKTEVAASFRGCNFHRGDDVLFFIKAVMSETRGKGEEVIATSSYCVSSHACGGTGISCAPGRSVSFSLGGEKGGLGG